MKKLKAIKSAYVRHPYDDERNWTQAGIWKPPEFDVARFQKKINDIVGLSPSGEPIVRLKWAWECRKWRNTNWDDFGNATEGEWRQRYVALTVELDNDDYCDISPPRWVLEERFEPSAIAGSWEASRYLRVISDVPSPTCRYCYALNWVDPHASTSELLTCIFCREITVLNSVRRDIHGPVPRDGWYNLLPYVGIIAEHDESVQCCDRKWAESREICYGRYKVPGEKELQRLKRAIHLRNQDAETNPHAELDPVALKQARQWAGETIEEQRVGKREELKAAIRDEVNTHGASVVPPEALVALKDAGRRVPVHKTWIT